MKKTIQAVMTVCLLLLTGIARANPFYENLLTNPGGETGDMTGWTVTANGGNGWAMTGAPVHSGSYAFATSYAWDTRYQEIDLLAAGFSTTVLDSEPDIMVGEWFGDRGDSGIQYYLNVELRDSSHNVITSWNTGTQVQSAGTGWTEQSYTFSDYGSGVRYVYFEDGGRDSNTWAGHYGAHLDDASVQVVPEPASLLLALSGLPAIYFLRRGLVGGFDSGEDDAGESVRG